MSLIMESNFPQPVRNSNRNTGSKSSIFSFSFALCTSWYFSYNMTDFCANLLCTNSYPNIYESTRRCSSGYKTVISDRTRSPISNLQIIHFLQQTVHLISLQLIFQFFDINPQLQILNSAVNINVSFHRCQFLTQVYHFSIYF